MSPANVKQPLVINTSRIYFNRHEQPCEQQLQKSRLENALGDLIDKLVGIEANSVSVYF